MLSGCAFTACENGERNSYETPSKMKVESIDSNEYIQLLIFTVNARDWRKLSSTDLYVDASIPAVTNEIIKEGSVIVYLNEAGKNLSLPFTYYQVRRALSFQPSYEEGHVYINILGNFILSASTTYTFKILIIQGKGLKKFKGVNWYNYDDVKTALNLMT